MKQLQTQTQTQTGLLRQLNHPFCLSVWRGKNPGTGLLETNAHKRGRWNKGIGCTRVDTNVTEVYLHKEHTLQLCLPDPCLAPVVCVKTHSDLYCNFWLTTGEFDVCICLYMHTYVLVLFFTYAHITDVCVH
jgi:hypothetical protein